MKEVVEMACMLLEMGTDTYMKSKCMLLSASREHLGDRHFFEVLLNSVEKKRQLPIENKGGKQEMKVDDIKIYPCFAAHEPKPEKMQEKEQYFEETGALQSQIILGSRGRNLKTGEYYDSKNKRYMFRKMIDGERITIAAPDLVELRKQENDLLFRIDRGNKLNTRNARMTLNAYFDFWMETFAKSGRKATTCTNYKSYYNTYIKNTIGKKQIAKITKADCQRIINEMVQDGKKHSTMSNLKSCLNIVFECALDDDIIIKNPAKNLQVPQTGSKKRTAIEQQQIDLFMGYVKNSERYSYSYPAFVVLFRTLDTLLHPWHWTHIRI